MGPFLDIKYAELIYGAHRGFNVRNWRLSRARFEAELGFERRGGSGGDSVSPRRVQEISIAPNRTPDFAKPWMWGQFE